jgi:hypothetical protein
MSRVVGIDLSTKAIDLVALEEDSNRAEWVRCELHGETAWERALNVWPAMRDSFSPGHWGWWDDVYLVAIEKPVNDQKRVLRLIQGAILASLPAQLRQPHCCWEVHPSTWKAELGLKGKPTWDDLQSQGMSGAEMRRFSEVSQTPLVDEAMAQNARDAYCLAMFARDTNARAVEKTLGAA